MHLPGDAVECEVHQGTLADAQWYSYAVNREHGLRRTNGDKERAVRAALAHPKSEGLSSRQIAEHVGVDEKTVRNYRRPSTAEIPQSVISDLTAEIPQSSSSAPLDPTSEVPKSTADGCALPSAAAATAEIPQSTPGGRRLPPWAKSTAEIPQSSSGAPVPTQSLEPTSEIPKSTAAGETESPAKRPRTGRDGRTINTAKIGRRTRRPRCATEYRQAKQEGRRSRFSSMVTPTLPNNHVRNCAYELLEYLTYDYLMKVFEEIRNLHQKRLEEGLADA